MKVIKLESILDSRLEILIGHGIRPIGREKKIEDKISHISGLSSLEKLVALLVLNMIKSRMLCACKYFTLLISSASICT